jgi:hypothetical protein
VLPLFIPQTPTTTMTLTTTLEMQKLWLIQQLLLIQDFTLTEQIKNIILDYESKENRMTWGEMQQKVEDYNNSYQNENYIIGDEM